MPLSFVDFVYGFVAPAVASAVLFLALRSLLPGNVGSRYASSVALACGFLLGYWLLRLGPWSPEANWHWLPYVALMTLAVGPVVQAAGVWPVERVLSHLLIAVVSGWLLTPTWESLDPSRTVHLVSWTVYVVVLACLLDPITKRLPGPLLPAILTVAFACGAAVLLLSGNLRFALIAGGGFGAMAGITACSCFNRQSRSLDGIALSYTVTLGGVLLVGRLSSSSDVPLASYGLVPLAPLLVGACMFGPLARLPQRTRLLAQIGLPLASCAIAVVMAVVAEWPLGVE